MSVLAASVLFAAGCSVATADQLAAPAGPRTALAIAPVKVRAPYDVQVLRDDGKVLPTYAHKDRFYVQGNDSERYVIRITNPTARRVEAVVTVDGLDVVDGENGDLRKRGYVVPPYGETRIEGFRTSQADVATFRFSSVSDSYAGKKGKARNVGVIAVALFEEQAAQEIVQPELTYRAPYDDYDYEGAAGPPPPRAPAGKAEGSPAKNAVSATAPAPASRRARPSAGDMAPAPDVARYRPPQEQEQPQSRLGLGTEFGEQRSSAVSFTKFVRAADRPIAIAELRYNDAAGLTALGILVTPLPDERELVTRETAEPFPGDLRFAPPPGR
jgi:hypothetical protein